MSSEHDMIGNTPRAVDRTITIHVPVTRAAQVTEFHRAFNLPIGGLDFMPDNDRVRLRARLIAEEFCEMLDAMFNLDGKETQVNAIGVLLADIIQDSTVRVDMPEFADALADLDYVIEGSRIEFGIDGAPVAAAVHAANMAKLGPDGRPIVRADGKVTKPEGWTPPDIAGELRKQGWEGP